MKFLGKKKKKTLEFVLQGAELASIKLLVTPKLVYTLKYKILKVGALIVLSWMPRIGGEKA
jgi:hypothetical protein